MDNWKEYVKKLIAYIEKYNGNVSVVGITGCYDSRENDDSALRVYMNGGCILKISLNVPGYYYADSYLKPNKKYVTDNEKTQLKRVIEIVDKDKLWKSGKDDFALLDQYLNIMNTATAKRFNKEQGENKERSKQTLLYSKSSKIEDFVLFDFEFQSTDKMNYANDTEVKEWLKKHPDRKKAHRGKPDYVAFDSDGFVLMELKTNKKSLEGNAGVGDHNDDIDNIIRVNNQNRVLTKELKERLKVSLEYGLINEGRQTAEKLMNKEDSDIIVKKRFVFLTGKEFSRDYCEKYVKEKNIKDVSIIL